MNYIELSQLYADHCSVCHGRQFVEVDGSPFRCICQKLATARARLEAVDIDPPSLKEKGWRDFTGLIFKNEEIRGSLTADSAIKGRNTAFRYCYGCDLQQDCKFDPQDLILNDHLITGRNVIITGPQNSGKTLLAVLILKEICRSYYTLDRNYQFKWAKFHDIINSARWGTHDKDIDYPLLDELSEQHFLFVDGVDVHKGGHNSPPDHVAMNVLFGRRKSENLPTILVCSPTFYQILSKQPGIEHIASLFGQEFAAIVSNPDNISIELTKA